MEFTRVPEEFTPPPEEYRLPAEPVDRPEEEFSPRSAARKPRGDNHGRLKRLMLLPLAATVAAASLWMSSFNVDPLGAGAADGEPRHEQPHGPQTEPAEEQTFTYQLHVTYTPTGESAAFSGEDEEQALAEAREWVAARGGDPDSLQYLRREEVLVDTIYSDDCIIVGDPDDMEHAYIAQGTVTYVYRRDIYCEAYGTEDEFPVLPNPDPDFAGNYAWGNEGPEEYVRLMPEGTQEMTYLHMGEAWRRIEGREEGTVPGAAYDRETNTLTLENFSGDILDVNLMGNGFTVRLIGENRLRMLMVWGAGYGGSVTFVGDGRLVIDGGDEPAIRLNAEGSQSCLMVDNGVTVEAYSNAAAVLINETALDPAVYCRRGVTVTGGADTVVDQVEIDGTTYYTHVMVDENGNPAAYVRFGAE